MVTQACVVSITAVTVPRTQSHLPHTVPGTFSPPVKMPPDSSGLFRGAFPIPNPHFAANGTLTVLWGNSPFQPIGASYSIFLAPESRFIMEPRRGKAIHAHRGRLSKHMNQKCSMEVSC